MDPLSIIILGLVQGVTEAIPLSSKTQDTLVYLTFLHGSTSMVVPILLYLNIGSVLAALIYFRNDIIQIAMDFLRRPLDVNAHANGRLGFLVVALLLTGVVGLPLLYLERKFFPTFDNALLFGIMGAGLMVTGIFLYLQKGAKVRKSESVTWKDGLITGALQGLSILPGVSRSGTSTTGLIWNGFESESSFYLSFLLSVPTILLAEILLSLGGGLTAFPVTDGILLALSAFVFGYLTIGAVLRLVRHVNLSYLAMGLGAFIIIVAALGLA
jgi:undecaprenyl-diphosphatase